MTRFLACMLTATLFVPTASAADVKLGELASATPEAWKMKDPSNKLRAYEFALPGADGKEDGELAIFFFGAGGGGDIKPNLDRWKSMFKAPAGKSIDDVSKVDTIKLDKAKLTYLDVSGIYLSKFPPFAPNAKTTEKPDYRRLGVVFECEGGPYFITLTGPAATLERHKADFDRWLKNFK